MASARRQERLLSLQAELAGIETHPADATRPADMEALVKRTRERLGEIDIVVYATGTNTPDRGLKRLNPETWDSVVAVNLNGAYYSTQAVLPGMRERGSGHLIYIASTSALAPDISGAAYQASKRGLLGFAHAVRFEEKGNGIRTCVICPRIGGYGTTRKASRKARPGAAGEGAAASRYRGGGARGSGDARSGHGSGNARSPQSYLMWRTHSCVLRRDFFSTRGVGRGPTRAQVLSRGTSAPRQPTKKSRSAPWWAPAGRSPYERLISSRRLRGWGRPSGSPAIQHILPDQKIQLPCFHI